MNGDEQGTAATKGAVHDAPQEMLKEVWLLGQPSLHEYLHFVEEMAPQEAARGRAALVGEWSAANDYYHELEQREAGEADAIECTELHGEMVDLAASIEADPRFRRTFDVLPTRFAMVELDRLIVCQKSVTLDFIKSLGAKVPASDRQALFRFCLPLDRREAAVTVERLGSRRFSFRCPSTDFRFREPILLKPDQIVDYDGVATMAHIIGLSVGFGPNFLTAVQVENRLLLQNGYHRACALREQGVTHAPCIVETVTRHDELALTAKDDVSTNPEFYFRAARPPLLKDFFDRRIRKVLDVHRLQQVIEVSFEIKEYAVNG